LFRSRRVTRRRHFLKLVFVRKWSIFRYAAFWNPTTMRFEEFQGKIKGGSIGAGLTA
jgi:hypothetical protein